MNTRYVPLALVTASIVVTSAAFPLNADEPRSDDDARLLRSLLDAHNRERAEAKLPPLTLDPKLTLAAQVHSKDMAAHRKMTHDGSDGSTPSDRIKRQNYPFMTDAENVAEGYRTVDSLMRGWMESEHHRENILGRYTQVGFGLARDEDGEPYWTTDFATPWEKLDPAKAADDLAKAINKARFDAGLPALKLNDKLSQGATEIASRFAEADSLDPKDPGDNLVTILKRLGYRFQKLAESAASGQPAAADVLRTWMDSKAHRQHVLDNFTEIGVGYSSSKSLKPYWCLVLARPLTD